MKYLKSHCKHVLPIILLGNVIAFSYINLVINRMKKSYFTETITLLMGGMPSSSIPHLIGVFILFLTVFLCQNQFYNFCKVIFGDFAKAHVHTFFGPCTQQVFS